MTPSTTVDTAPLRRDAQRNRDRIVAAARELFAERGMEVTLNEIAHYAGVGVGTVYRRFPDKDVLVEEVLQARFGEVADLMHRAAADPDPWRGLTGFLYGSLELQAQDRALSDILLGAPLSAQRLSAMRAAMVPVARDLIDRAHASGQLRADFDVSDLPVLVLMIRTAVDVTRTSAPEVWRRFAGIAIQGIRAAGAPLEPLAVAPIGIDRIDAVMESWRPMPL